MIYFVVIQFFYLYYHELVVVVVVKHVVVLRIQFKNAIPKNLGNQIRVSILGGASAPRHAYSVERKYSHAALPGE